MTRGFVTYGEAMVYVRGPEGSIIEEITELGLCSESIRITPRYNHLDILTDDFGPSVPVEVLSNMADAKVSMTLVHFDWNIVDYCMYLAMGGTGPVNDEQDYDGSLSQAGSPLGFGKPMYDPSNHYVSLYLRSATETLSPPTNVPYRFICSYLDGQPLEIPLGTERSLLQLSWRVIPYRPFTGDEISSEGGLKLWDHLFT